MTFNTDLVTLSRRGLLGASLATLTVAPRPSGAAPSEDLPPDAMKAYGQYSPKLQLSADYYLFGLADDVADASLWGRAAQQVSSKSVQAERTFYTPLRAISLSFLDDDLSDDVTAFQKAGNTLGDILIEGAKMTEVPPAELSRAKAAHAAGAAALAQVFKRINALTGDSSLSADAKTRDRGRYIRLVKQLAQCQQAGGTMVSVQTKGLTCGDALEAAYLSGEL